MHITRHTAAFLAAILALICTLAPQALAQPSAPGACCVVNSQGSLVCVVLTQSDCTSIGGQFHGRGTRCTSPNPCPGAPTGACCLPPPAQGGGGQGTRICVVLNEVQCSLRGGTFQGNATTCTQTACPPPPPALGACCSAQLGCVLLTQLDCRRRGGNYRGDNTACSPSPCPGAPTGACCLPPQGQGQGGGGHPVCINVTELVCQNRGGIYQGDATVCTPTICPTPPPQLFACCIGSTCQLLTPRDCRALGGSTITHNTSCTPSPCPGAPAGACCIGGQSGAGGGGSGAIRCVVLTELACRTHSGIYRGDGTTCQSISCIPPTIGACCIAVPSGGHQCLQLSPLACSSLSGTFSGLGIPCIAVPCPPVPPPCPCDINGDGIVDALDEVAFLAGFAAMSMDLDGDGDTDLDDWSIFYSCFPQGCP